MLPYVNIAQIMLLGIKEDFINCFFLLCGYTLNIPFKSPE